MKSILNSIRENIVNECYGDGPWAPGCGTPNPYIRKITHKPNTTDRAIFLNDQLLKFNKVIYDNTNIKLDDNALRMVENNVMQITVKSESDCSKLAKFIKTLDNNEDFWREYYDKSPKIHKKFLNKGVDLVVKIYIIPENITINLPKFK